MATPTFTLQPDGTLVVSGISHAERDFIESLLARMRKDALSRPAPLGPRHPVFTSIGE